MGVRVLNLRDTVMRIYDQTANTPNYVTVLFIDGTMTLPDAPPRPEDEYVNNQGKADANHHYIIGDDAATFEPQEVALTGLLDASVVADKVFKAMSNPQNAGTWQPDGSTTFTPVTTMGTRINADGTAVTCKVPADSVKADGLVNVEVLATNPDGSGDDFGIKLTGCYFSPPQVSFANPRGTFETTIMVYGAIAELASFTTPATAL